MDEERFLHFTHTPQSVRFEKNKDGDGNEVIRGQCHISNSTLPLRVRANEQVDLVPNVRQELVPALQNGERKNHFGVVVELEIRAIKLSQRVRELNLIHHQHAYCTDELRRHVEVLQRRQRKRNARLVEGGHAVRVVVEDGTRERLGNEAKQTVVDGLAVRGEDGANDRDHALLLLADLGVLAETLDEKVHVLQKLPPFFSQTALKRGEDVRVALLGERRCSADEVQRVLRLAIRG